MQQRLCGREQEYGMAVLPEYNPSRFKEFIDPVNPPTEEGFFRGWREKIVLRCIDHIVYDNYLNSTAIWDRIDSVRKIWLSNGSLIYVDMQCLLEHATAECSVHTLDLITQEKASELLINKAAQEVRKDMGLELLYFYKNNCGPENGDDLYKENTYASHHNYSYLKEEKENVQETLITFIPLNILISGNGHLYRNYNNEIKYALSQRALYMEETTGQQTTEKRPIINSKEDSLMKTSTKLSRLHLISCDATRCEFQTWLTTMTIHLVIRLAEEGWKVPYNIKTSNPVARMRVINNLLLDNDYLIKETLDKNFIFLNAAKQLKYLSESEKDALDEWERVLNLLKDKAYGKLIGELDWTTKLMLIKNKMKKHHFNLSDVRAWQINMEYHNISNNPKRSWFSRLDELGFISHLVSEEDVKKAIFTPPPTRAQTRSLFVKLCSQNPRLRIFFPSMDWGTLSIKGSKESFYFGEDANPFIPNDEILKKAIIEIESQ